MKRKLISSLLFLITVVNATAQTKQDIFKPSVPITWLGLDFSRAKLIGDRERLNSPAVIRNLLYSMNEVILQEPDKYDIAGAVQRKMVDRAIVLTSTKNYYLDTEKLLMGPEDGIAKLTKSDIAEIVASYDYKDMDGIGLMFNVEALDKNQQQASVFVTFIDMKKKEVLFTSRLIAEPHGFGPRNYWGGAIYDIIKDLKKGRFTSWKKESKKDAA